MPDILNIPNEVFKALDEGGVLYMFHLLKSELNRIKDEGEKALEACKPTDSLEEGGTNAVTAGAIYTEIQNVVNGVDKLLEVIEQVSQDKATSIIPDSPDADKQYPSVQAVMDYINSLISNGITADDEGLTRGKQVVEYVKSVVKDYVSGGYVYEDTLPDPNEGIEGKMYLTPHEGGSQPNLKDEWIIATNEDGEKYWELIGSTQLDLSDYLTKNDVRPITNVEIKEMWDRVMHPEAAAAAYIRRSTK